MKILPKIEGPQDLKTLTNEELSTLAEEIRETLIKKLSLHGGHLGPNLGFVEATIALHYVFNSPLDKFIFDVSHQTYSHKILTGRKEAFLSEEHYNDVSGYTNPEESDHDLFNVGHTSTSISLASGVATARDLQNEKYNVIAIIGDGSLSGGEALEGLDFAGNMNTNLIIIVNDNNMSIAPNHGGLYKSLKDLRETNGQSTNNIFKAMGLDYTFVKDGNSLPELITTFKQVKDINHPIVVHIVTEKGKGFKPAETHKEQWHWTMPFDINNPEKKPVSPSEDFGEITGRYLLGKIKQDPRVAVVVAAVPTNIGFNEERRKEAKSQFIDVAIAEEHAIALVSGIAKNHGKPVFATYSSFIQRTYDQMSQDLCINNNPATILVNGASIYGMNDVTHLGIYDIPLLSNIPNLVYLAPTSKEEYLNMLSWSIEQENHPVAIRIPCNEVVTDNRVPDKNYDNINTYKMEQLGNNIAILALGDFYQLGEKLSQDIETELNIKPTLINPRFITGLDKKMLSSLKENHNTIITLEDGILDGGFGQKIASYYGKDNIKVLNYGLEKKFYDRYKVEEVLKENRLTPEQIIDDIKNLKQNK